ncbi:DEAD/DEAH box helicase [Puteibacter caeruleilacunae]|nr:DEAD/DEAH box helicase [Puteibacter caeruleilacunae]
MQKFQETGLKPEILKSIEALGFEEPTPIQEKTIPAIISSSNDIIALAQTGTGKTAAFGLPIIHKSDVESKKVQTLVLCPTRELCIQITKDLQNYSKYVPGFRVISVYGGANIEPQIRALKSGGQIVVGTPGRVVDLINRRALKISNIQWLVFDEADEMLNMGFKDDLDTILAETPEEKQTLLFSATMPKGIIDISQKYMENATEISVGKRNQGAENVTHEYYMVRARDRYNALKRIADLNPNIYGIIFCRTRMETKEVADKLIGDGYNADALHGDLSQAQRDSVMNKFRQKHLQLLVATDVAARGLDVNDLTHVINYNLPDDTEVYVHRSGRTGRAGKSGISMAIVHSRETRKVRDIEKIIRKKFVKKPVPGGKEICEKQLFHLIDKVEKIEVETAQIEPFMQDIYEKLSFLSREELIQHFVSLEFNRFLDYYKNAPDLNISENSPATAQRNAKAGYSRFFINVGSKGNLNASTLIKLIIDQPTLKNVEIGKIDIMKKFSFFEIETQAERKVMEAFKRVRFNDKPVAVELSKPSGKANPRSNGQQRRSNNGGQRRDFRKPRQQRRR